jgi:UDP-N-acetylmuramoyl-L-alanyl-D-glutamate--2,6-diaminopimelate ligase
MCSKPLTELLALLPKQHSVTQWQGGDVPITSITQDSRLVTKGTLFAAIKGEKHNGEDYILAAIDAGAVAILVSDDYDISHVKNAAIITHPNPRVALSLLAQAFYQPQPTHKIAVTGTDGKTSTAEFVRQLWEMLAKPAISIGTLGLKSARPLSNLPTLSDNTSPEQVSFYQALNVAAIQEVQNVVTEASSIGIEQHRLSGFAPNVAIFTSFSQDHLDYHGTMEAYFAAKAQLFTEILQPQGTAILCADYPEIRELAQSLNHHVITYGTHESADLRITNITPNATGQNVTCIYQGTQYQFNIPIYGDFQAYNIIASMLAICADCHLNFADIISLCERLKPIKGRLELAGQKNGALIFVDYAHTAGALAKALQTLRPYAQNKLHLIFGCGGDRDKSKRAQMGKVAHNIADYVIITDDNPRTEDAATIRASIKSTCPNALEIADRATAIKHAISQLKTGDVLLIAGKGHENYQIIGTFRLHFDDVEEVNKNLP